MNFYWTNSNWKKILIDFILIFIFSANGFLLGGIVSNITKANGEKLNLFVLSFASLFPILSYVFTGITTKQPFIFSYHPLRKYKVAILDFAVYFICNTMNWLVFLFLICYTFFSKSLTSILTIQALCSWILSFVLAENFKLSLSLKKENRYFRILIYIINIVGIYLFFNYFIHQIFATIIIALLLLSNIIIYLFSYENDLTEDCSNRGKIKINFGNGTFRSAYRNANVWITLGMTFAFKYVFFLIFLHYGNKSQEFVSLIILTPIIYFTNFFNNAYGWTHGVILNYIIKEVKFKKILLNYIFLIIPVLLTDFLIQSYISYLSGVLNKVYIYFYIYCAIYMSFIGFVGSLVFYRLVTKTISFSNPYTTNIVVNLVSFFPFLAYNGNFLGVNNKEILYIVFMLFAFCALLFVYIKYHDVVKLIKKKLIL